MTGEQRDLLLELLASYRVRLEADLREIGELGELRDVEAEAAAMISAAIVLVDDTVAVLEAMP